MMNPNKQAPVRNSSAGLLLKVGGLFAVSFALFFMAFMAYDLLSGFAKNSAPAAQANEEIKPDVDIPKIADDLAKVLSSNAEPNLQEVKDPFSDRGGLSSASNAASASNTATVAASKSGTASAPDNATVTSGRGTASSGSPETVVVKGTKERYDEWDKRARDTGDTTIDPRIFAIQDLQPVGIVDGGNGQQEIMFCSESVSRTMSFPVGTMFYDGWIAELGTNGVVFSSNDVQRNVWTQPWVRSLKSDGCKKPYVNPLLNLSVENLQKLVLIKDLSR